MWKHQSCIDFAAFLYRKIKATHNISSGAREAKKNNVSISFWSAFHLVHNSNLASRWFTNLCLLLLPLRYPFPELINLKFKFVGSQWLDERSPNILYSQKDPNTKKHLFYLFDVVVVCACVFVCGGCVSLMLCCS